MEKKSFFENISEIKDNVKLYLDAKVSLLILTAFEKAVKALTSFISSTAILLLIVISFFFFSLAGALYIGKLLGSAELGLLIVGGIYLFLGFVFFLFRRQIFSRIIISYLTEVFFKDDDDEDQKQKQK
jgi:hypothetical protein